MRKHLVELYPALIERDRTLIGSNQTRPESDQTSSDASQPNPPDPLSNVIRPI